MRDHKSLGVVSAHGVKGVEIAFSLQPPKLAKYRGERTVTEVIFDEATSTLKAEIYLSIKHGKVIDTSWETWGATGLVNSVTSVP